MGEFIEKLIGQIDNPETLKSLKKICLGDDKKTGTSYGHMECLEKEQGYDGILVEELNRYQEHLNNLFNGKESETTLRDGLEDKIEKHGKKRVKSLK